MNKLVGYVSAYVSMLIPEIKEFGIKEIILYGSAAREDDSEESDIDVFINILEEKDEEKIEKIAKEVLGKFYKSEGFKKWALMGIRKTIELNVGILEKWKLKRSVISDGVLLYGKYKQIPDKFDQFSLFAFNPIKDITKRNRVIRTLFGREEKKCTTEGLIKKYKGKRLSERSFIIHASAVPTIMKIFSKEKLDYKIYDIWSDQF